MDRIAKPVLLFKLMIEEKVEQDLARIDFPPKPWRFEKEGVLDVAIIGGGISGLAAAFALQRRGIFKIQIYDENPPGKEGPWATYARMPHLRSPKKWMGPALGIPSLTFHSWFEAKHGAEEWDKFTKVSREHWMEYLIWYRHVLKLPVKNDAKLLSILPQKGHFQLHLTKEMVLAQKVVLATGRAGFGGPKIPNVFLKVPKSDWAHTNEIIDFHALKGKRVAVIGGGDSAFDAAGCALKHGAKSADLFCRRDKLPNTNPGRELYFQGLWAGYYQLEDAEKWKIACHLADKGTTVPIETLKRISEFPNFRFHSGVDIEKVIGEYDFYILGTGLEIDGTKQPELKPFMDDILLWRDRGFKDHAGLGRFPYLGPHFEFMGNAPYLKNLYCFNFGAFLSHAHLSLDIPPISYGAELLAQGIAADFFLEDKAKHIEKYIKYDDPEFLHADFPIFSK